MNLSIFKRVISRGVYRPEIDGLRFIAIVSVLLFHVDAFLNLYMKKTSILSDVWFTGHFGVPLFFSISGFVLTSQILKSKKFSYKQYIIRRIERIEPPFLITTLIFFFLLSFRDGFDPEKNYSLFRVLTYTSNFDTNLINVVTWSLEIEVVFYLILPLLFLLAKRDIWKWLLLALAAFIFSQLYEIQFLTRFFHWFIIGIVLAILETRKKMIIPYAELCKILVFLSLALFFGLAFFENHLVVEILQPILLFIFLYGVLIEGYFVKILSFQLFTIIGGACYIIYLIHFQVISVTGHFLIPLVPNRELLAILMLISTTFICLLAFPILERPFMKRKWWKRN
ncbi:acyltransferase family protein [Maribacter stanieri]|uniref:acyltransferase family protein n=1 Tax=Maribacter stanieri TaxID=440514 RepID=UPI002494A83A|nr:acyltransferase [Maribacter stanieri]